MPTLTNIMTAARTSPLSRAQVQEVQCNLRVHHPSIYLEGVFIQSAGDLDLKTSLRTLVGRTDFFTREVDSLLLEGRCRIAVHSAKDLPEFLAPGLSVICITRGLDPSDALVMRESQTLDSLPPHAVIATSSERREEAVRNIRPDVTFRDVRGTIEQRLALLDQAAADGVVVAEAALIRLGLTSRNRVILPGPTVPFQGQLAVVARSDDDEMKRLFACLDIGCQ